MKQPVNKYRYNVTNINGTVLTAAFGESGFSIEWDLNDEDLLDYTRNFPGKIVFRGEDFQNLYTIEKTATRCDLNLISIERNCGGAWVPWFSGRFSLNDSTWNLYRCEVEIKLQKFEDADCIEDSKSKEINLFDFIPFRQTVHLYNSAIHINTVTYQTVDNLVDPQGCNSLEYWAGAGDPAAQGYVAYYHFYQLEDLPASARKCYRETRWARQELTIPAASPSPGLGWVLLSTTGPDSLYIKPAALTNCQESQVEPSGNILGGYKKECEILGIGDNLNFIDNGMPLKQCFEAFATSFCPGMEVKSEFFQINPDVVTVTNYVTGQDSKVNNLVLFQKSDVKRPNVSGNATKAEISWEKFIAALVFIFNVRWRVVGNVLRVEHVSYFNRLAGYDLTVGKYSEYIKTMAKYSYKTEEIPEREEFKFMEASAGDFAGLPIIYSGGCVSSKASPKTNVAENFTTDVELCINNPDPKSSIVDDKGFVLMACDEFRQVLSEAPILSTTQRLNNTLAWAQLQRDYHRHYRPLKYGNMNGQPTTFESVKPLKKGVTVNISLCCGDTFNPDDLITTTLGDGVVEKATFSFKTDSLALDLVYPADDDLTIPPIATNDVFNIAKDTSADFDVIANDTPSPSAGITIIEIMVPPLHGTATVIAGPKIHYTPDAGYFGDDNLVYRVKDGVNLPSNNALVAINISANIFVSLVEVSDTESFTTLVCSAPFSGNINGSFKTKTFRLFFYSDNVGTPVDVTGLNLQINYRKSGVYNNPANAPTVIDSNVVPDGFSYDIETDYEYYRSELDCNRAYTAFKNETFSLLPGAYTII